MIMIIIIQFQPPQHPYLGMDHYFPGRSVVTNVLLQTIFFNICLNNFFSHIMFANNLFGLFRPCNFFFYFTHPHPPPKKIMVRPLGNVVPTGNPPPSSS